MKVVKSAMQGRHKFVTFQRLIKHVFMQAGHLNADAHKALKTDFKIWQRVFEKEDYSKIISSILPSNFAVLILQFSSDQR